MFVGLSLKTCQAVLVESSLIIMEFYSYTLITKKYLLVHMTVPISSLGYTILQNGDPSIHSHTVTAFHTAWPILGAHVEQINVIYLNLRAKQ